MRDRGTNAGVQQLALALSLFLSAFCLPQQQRDVVLATTTSTRDAGLLDSLLPVFEAKSAYKVKVVAVGTGQAIAMARRGDAEIVLVHAPELERALVDSGFFVRRRLVMHDDFLFVGPESDPARIRGGRDAVAALAATAAARAPFVSRGDRSGTHLLELKLWRLLGQAPPPPGGWYIEAGQGMAATLQMADEKRAYTITDRPTFLVWQSKLQLVPLVEGDTLLYNVYHVMEVPHAGAGARALADFFVAPEAQELIGKFGTARFGKQLFAPDAGKPDRW
ncbi:MAG: tungsten ABC transporter substrate-binding protein [Gemmatimonadetes bacterium]|nr:MAG: tungsten ABC transporter substrate-binding protein [Gemmatimonadota bacterium]